MDNKTIFAFVTTFILLLAGCGVLIANGSDTSEAADSNVSVTVAQGQSWTYTISVNLDNPSYSISGSATSWVTLNGSEVSGTVPAVGSSATTLVITATTSQPAQSYTQTINFTITEGVGFALGPNVNGSLNLTTGLLQITGSGDMYSFSSAEHYDNPFGDYAEYLTSIDIGEDVTSIGDFFAGYPEVPTEINYISNVVSLTGGEGITTIGLDGLTYLGRDTTYGCSVEWMAFESLETIGISAFYYAKLNGVLIPDTVTTIGNYAFSGVPWHFLVIGNGLTSIGTNVFTYENTEITFYEHDNTTVVSGVNIKADVYCRNNVTSTTCFANTSGSVTNSTYSNDYTYFVSGKAVPNTLNGNVVAADNVRFLFGVNDPAVVEEYLPEYIAALDNATIVWTLEDSIGSAAIGSTPYSGNGGSFTSGTAPTVSASTTISTSAIATVTATDGASVTISSSAGLDFNALIAPELQFTSTP